ncbi:MAG: MFS transporter, partial [Clostridium perfringens]
RNKPSILAFIGQLLFGFTLYGRNSNSLYYFTFVEGTVKFFSTYSLAIMIPSIIGAACFPLLFKLTKNKGRTASIFAFFTGISMIILYKFSVITSPVMFYTFSALSQFFFSGFNTAIYAIIPDCVEYGEWKTGIRNDGFQYAFISLGNKIGMALGTSILALALGAFGYVANQEQNSAVIGIMKHSFTTIPGILWVITGVVLLFYKLNKTSYNKIISELNIRKTCSNN